ncbi:MAG: polyketide synthase dehydratase domain-containing protein, partial [Roseococcus sp.]
PMVSTVTGGMVEGSTLDGDYWWSNIRAPILFQAAVESALEEADLFIEIGPRPILGALVTEIARHAGARAVALATLAQGARAEEADPVPRILLEAIAKGASLGVATAIETDGPALGPRILPLMRWDRQFYLIGQSSEAYGIYGPSFGGAPIHPLVGLRLAPGGVEWRQILSLETLPFLGGHRVDGEVVFPATGYMEMMLAIGREVHGTSRLRILDLDILRPITFEAGGGREVSVLWHEAERLVEIRSRPRFDADGAFVLQARGVILPETGATPAAEELPPEGETHDEGSLYAATERCRFGYGGAFRAAVSARVTGDVTVTEVVPEPADLGFFADTQVIDPPSYDAALHGIFLSVAQKPGQVLGELPIRMERLSLFEPGTPIARSMARLCRETRDARVFHVAFLSAEGGVVAEAQGVVMRRVIFSSWREADRIVQARLIPWESGAADIVPAMLEALSHPPLACQAAAKARPALIGLAMDIATHVVATLAGPCLPAQDLSLGGQIPAGAMVVWRALIDALCDAGRMVEREEQLLLTAAAPDPTAAWAEFGRAHPAASADLRLALHALDALPVLLATGREAPPNADLLDAVLTASVFAAPCHDALAEVLDRLIRPEADRRLKIVLLEPGLSGLLARLLPRCRTGEVELAILAADEEAAERLLARLGAARMIPVHGPDAHMGTEVFDLALCAAVTPLDGGEPSPLDMLASLGEQAPPLLVASPDHDPAIDVLHAAIPGWFRFSPTPELPVGLWPYPSEADEALTSHGFAVQRYAAVAAAGVRLVFATLAQRVALPLPARRIPLCVAAGDDLQAAAFRSWLPGFELRPALSLADLAELGPATVLPEGFA